MPHGVVDKGHEHEEEEEQHEDDKLGVTALSTHAILGHPLLTALTAHVGHIEDTGTLPVHLVMMQHNCH